MQINDLVRQIQSLRQTISGDPNAHLQDYIKQNNIPQSTLDYAQQQANDVYRVMQALFGK